MKTSIAMLAQYSFASVVGLVGTVYFSCMGPSLIAVPCALSVFFGYLGFGGVTGDAAAREASDPWSSKHLAIQRTQLAFLVPPLLHVLCRPFLFP